MKKRTLLTLSLLCLVVGTTLIILGLSKPSQADVITGSAQEGINVLLVWGGGTMMGFLVLLGAFLMM